MENDLKKSIEILERTPLVLDALLSGISPEWQLQNEGGESWSPYDILGHLIHGEKTDWIPRMELILSEKEEKKFEAYDRFAQIKESRGKTISDLLLEFRDLRKKNIMILKERDPGPEDLEKEGIHPDFGLVKLKQLLSTWVVHDLNHIAQITRVMARQYREEVGPWQEYLRILHT